MSNAPILNCNESRELVAALAGRDALRGLASLRTSLASAVLAAPAALARSIAERAPQLAARTELSIIVIGAETTDAVDQGRWYQMVPAMLDSSVNVRVTLVGASLDASFASAASTHAPVTAAHCVRTGLDEYLDANPLERFDVAVVFQPGLQKYRGWLQDNGFARLLAAGTLLFGTSNADDEYEMERWVLECHGYTASEQPLANPFYLELGDAGSPIHWGGSLWQIEAPPPPAFKINQQGLAALDTLTRMVMHSMTVVREASPPLGAVVELSAGGGLQKTLIHLFDRRFVDATDGSIVQLAADGALKSIGHLPAAELARYPRNARREIERAMWAANMKASYLLASYVASIYEVEGAATAASMLEAMRQRAAGLFR